jgi:MFS family permease
VAEIFKKEDQGKAIGIYFSGTKIGVTLGISLSAAILAAYGWRAVFVVTGLLSLLWLVPWFLIYRPGKGVLKETIAAPGAAQTAERIKWRSLFAYREVWALMLGQGGYLYVYFVFLTWLPSYLILERKMSILKTGILGMFPFLIAIFVGIFSGWLGDRWLKAGGQLSVVRKTFIGGGFALSTTFILIAINVRSTVPALFCLFMSMGILGMVSPNINALPIDLAPRRIVSTVAALQNVGGNVGGALAPMVTGLLYGMTGNFKVALLATAGVALVFGTFVHIFMLGKIEPCIGIKKQSAAAS